MSNDMSQPTLEEMLLANYGQLSSLAYDTFPQLLVFDHEAIFEKLFATIAPISQITPEIRAKACKRAEKYVCKRPPVCGCQLCAIRYESAQVEKREATGELVRYSGSVEFEPFTRWAKAFVEQESLRVEFIERVVKEHLHNIRFGVRKALPSEDGPDDWSVEELDLIWGAISIIGREAFSLSKPGTASLATRLTGLAYRHTLDYFTKPLKRQRQRVATSLQLGMVPQTEFVTDLELASLRAEELTEAG